MQRNRANSIKLHQVTSGLDVLHKIECHDIWKFQPKQLSLKVHFYLWLRSSKSSRANGASEATRYEMKTLHLISDHRQNRMKRCLAPNRLSMRCKTQRRDLTSKGEDWKQYWKLRDLKKGGGVRVDAEERVGDGSITPSCYTSTNRYTSLTFLLWVSICMQPVARLAAMDETIVDSVVHLVNARIPEKCVAWFPLCSKH